MTIGVLAREQGELEEMPVGRRVASIGRNTGNLAFAHAMVSHIAEPVSFVNWQDNPQQVGERCRVLVVPEASAMNPVRDYSARADFLDTAKVPVVVMGLGAQARRIGDHVPLQAGTIRYLRALARWSETIGVRGEYSGEVLRSYGVGNYDVVGCPSNFIRRYEQPLLVVRGGCGPGTFPRMVVGYRIKGFLGSALPQSREVPGVQ